MHLRFLALVLVGLLVPSLRAANRTFVVVTNQAMIHHWPAADALIGTADDKVSNSLSAYGRSLPNTIGSYSYVATSFGLSPTPDPFLFGAFDTVTFVNGRAVIDPANPLIGNIPSVVELGFSGTDLFPGHGAYEIHLTRAYPERSEPGAYRREGDLYTFNAWYDIEGTFAAGVARATNVLGAGTVALVEAASFNSPQVATWEPSLVAYLKDVAVPFAKQLGASALIFGRIHLVTTGSVPGTPGYFPPLDATSVVLAMEFAAVPPTFRVAGIQITSTQVQLSWIAVTGKVYAVEAADAPQGPFTAVADNVTQTTLALPRSPVSPQQFYRIRAH